MELLEAVQRSTKSTAKHPKLISWKKVTAFMEAGTPKQWEASYRSRYGDKCHGTTKEKSKVSQQLNGDHQKGITEPESILISQLKNERTIDELCYATSKPRIEVLGMIEELRLLGYDIVQVRIGDVIAYTVNTMMPTTYFEYKHYHDVKHIIRIGLVSDTHMGSIFFQNTYLQMAYDDFASRGITDVYHVGDLSDGFYSNRPSSIYELYALGFDQQVDCIVDQYPRRHGITTYFITGNHDATHLMNGGANIGKAIEKSRPDMKYLGHEYAKIWLTDKVDMDLIHPRDGSAYALSYQLQKRINGMSGGLKPKVLVTGHYHKYFDMFYRNIIAISMASFQAQSSFMRGKNLDSDVGYMILELQVNDHGDIIQSMPLYRPLYIPIKEKF